MPRIQGRIWAHPEQESLAQMVMFHGLFHQFGGSHLWRHPHPCFCIMCTYKKVHAYGHHFFGAMKFIMVIDEMYLDKSPSIKFADSRDSRREGMDYRVGTEHVVKIHTGRVHTWFSLKFARFKDTLKIW